MTLEKVRESVLDSSSCVAGTEASERRAGAHTSQKILQDPLRWLSMIVNLTWVRGFRVTSVWARSCFYGGLIRQRRSGMWVALSSRLTFHFKGESRGWAASLLPCFLTSVRHSVTSLTLVLTVTVTLSSGPPFLPPAAFILYFVSGMGEQRLDLSLDYPC